MAPFGVVFFEDLECFTYFTIHIYGQEIIQGHILIIGLVGGIHKDKVTAKADVKQSMM